MNEPHRKIALGWLKSFEESGKEPYRRLDYDSSEAVDRARIESLPALQREIKCFLQREMDLPSLKEQNWKLTLQYDHWGFGGFSGQMVLNQLNNWSGGSESMADVLRRALKLPGSQSEASDQIRQFTASAIKLLPKEKSFRYKTIPFLLSYFWQIQDPAKLPIYYSASRRLLTEEGMMPSIEDQGEQYLAFCKLMDELVELYQSRTKAEKYPYWFVEHVLWAVVQLEKELSKPTTPTLPKRGAKAASDRDWTSYVPPIVSNLPAMALDSDKSNDFERAVMLVFRMLGYQVDNLGQGTGRQPDGVACAREFNYAIIFDAKSSKDGYALGTDDRRIAEYIQTHKKRLAKDGYRNLYFVLVSSGFRGDMRPAFQRIRQQTGVQSVVTLTAEQALQLLAHRIKNPLSFDLENLETVFMESGPLDDAGLRELLDQE